MLASLDVLRSQASRLTATDFLRFHPGCWIQFYDDTAEKDEGKALSTATFGRAIIASKQAEHCAACFSLQEFRGSRTKEGLVSYRNLGADVDLVKAPERWSLPVAEIDRRKDAYLAECLRPFPLQPHWLIETRHGFHIIFRVLPVRDAAAVREAEGLNRRLVHALRGDDNATVLTQVLRIPGTLQFKDPAHPFLCRLLVDTVATVPPYALPRVRALLDAWEGPSGQHTTGPQQPVGPGQKGNVPGRNWLPLLAGVPEGQRNSSAAVVVGAILGRLPSDLWGIAGWGGLKEWNNQNVSPLPERELRSVFESIVRRECLKRKAATLTRMPVDLKRFSGNIPTGDDETGSRRPVSAVRPQVSPSGVPAGTEAVSPENQPSSAPALP